MSLNKSSNNLVENSKTQNLRDDSYQAAFTVSWWQEHIISEAMQKGASAAAETLKHMGGV